MIIAFGLLVWFMIMIFLYGLQWWAEFTTSRDYSLVTYVAPIIGLAILIISSIIQFGGK